MVHRNIIRLLWIAAFIVWAFIIAPFIGNLDQSSPFTTLLWLIWGAALFVAGYTSDLWTKILRSPFKRTQNGEPIGRLAREALAAGMPDTAPPEPADAAGLQNKLSSVFERVPLEQQIGEFAAAGLSLLPGRTVEDLLRSYPREEYENDPYQCLLFIYAIEVEAEPWGRWFTGKGWNWDTECIGAPGSYVDVLRNFERLTGEEVFTTLSDDAVAGSSGTAHITYAIKGGETRKQPVEINNDWADTLAVFAILEEIENAVGDDRRFYTGDNGQSIIVYFISEKTVQAINKLRPGLLY